MNAPAFLHGGGKMGVLMRAHDWSATPLGPARGWSQPLRIVVRLMLNTHHPMFLFWGPTLACLYNDAYSASIGPERHPGALGRPAREVWAEIWDTIGSQIEQVMSGGTATWHENQLVPITRHGRLDDVYWTYSFSPVDQEASATGVGGVLVVCTETTAQVLAERVQAERVLARTAERDRIWGNSLDMLILIDFAGAIQATSPSWLNTLGYERDELVGRRFDRFIDPKDAGSYHAISERLLTEPVPRFETRCRHKDGSWRWIDWTAVAEGKLIYAIGRDMTVAKRQAYALAQAEGALRQAQKMEAVGQLTAGIAHDFNNMLQAVASGIELARRRIASGRPNDAPKFLDIARETLDRAGALTQRLLAFGRRQALDPRPVQLNDLVRGMAALIQRTVGPAVEVELALHDPYWLVHCDSKQLESALLNLAINARDAMLPGGGKLLIETAQTTLDAAGTSGWDGAIPGGYMRVTISDTGAGMAPDVLVHAFEPFFTTKSIGQGSGLGLSQVYGFVRQSNGVAHLESKPGAGTSVHLYLPRSYVVPAGAARPVATGTPSHSARSEPVATVLVVEDEDAVRACTAEALRELGYRVLEACDGPEGLAALRATLDGPNEHRVDLLMTDIGLPGGLNGRQLADAARELAPALPVLMVTGYAGLAMEGEGRLGPAMEVLGKPFQLDVMAGRVQAMIQQARQG